MSEERRRAPRYQFIAEAKITEIASDTTFTGQTGDISGGGCFLDMLNPSPEGSEIRVTIRQGDQTFTALGRVAFVFPNVGMGVAFTRVEEGQLMILHKWLAELSGGE
jgi:PilZ domain